MEKKMNEGTRGKKEQPSQAQVNCSMREELQHA